MHQGSVGAKAKGLLDVPDHVQTRYMLPYLQVADLCRLACASKRLQSVAERDEVWLPRCNARWTGKAGVSCDQIFPRAQMDEKALEALSTKELKLVCASLHLDTSRFLDKAEFRAAIVRARPLRGAAPLGPSRRGKYKASYVSVELDQRRQILTDDELISIEWIFFFKHNPQSFTSKAQFMRDGKFMMSPWPMPNPESLHWRREHNGAVAIHHFPGHHPRRLKDFSFVLENAHVIFFQHFPGFDAARAVELIHDRMDDDEYEDDE